MSDQIEHLHRKIASLAKELDRVKNNSAPTLPIYDSTNFPQDAVDGQVAIAQSSSGIINQNSAWVYRNGTWQELGSGGDIRFNYDNEGGYLYINTNDTQGITLSDTTPSGLSPFVASSGIVLVTNPSADSEDNGNAGRIRLIDASHDLPLQIWKTGVAGEGAGIHIFADSGPPGTTPGLSGGDIAIQQFGSGRLYLGSGNLFAGDIQIEAWAANGSNKVIIDSVSASYPAIGNQIIVGGIHDVLVGPQEQQILLMNNAGTIMMDEGDGGIQIRSGTASFILGGSVRPVQIEAFESFVSIDPLMVMTAFDIGATLPTPPFGNQAGLYAATSPTGHIELWAICGTTRVRLATN